MKWEKQRNGQWKLIGPAKGKVDPDGPDYMRNLKAQMKKIVKFCDTCNTKYTLADPCPHHLSDSPEHREKYKAYIASQKKKREVVDDGKQERFI